MPAELVIAPEAELDIAEACVWYEGRRTGLGEEFLSSVDACVESIKRRPEMYPTVLKDYRRALVRRFPYAVLYYAPADESLNGDFRSFRPCTLITATPIDWNDQIVPPKIKTRLGLQGRFYQLYDFSLFEEILKTKDLAGTVEPRDLGRRLARFFEALSPMLREKLVEYFPQKDLSCLCEDLFSRMGYSVVLQEGPSERGSDLLVTVGPELLPRQFVVGVQVFAYSGEITANALAAKLNQLLSGWDENRLDHGALLTTGSCGDVGAQLIAQHNKANPDRLVVLIDSTSLSNLFLRYYDVPKV